MDTHIIPETAAVAAGRSVVADRAAPKPHCPASFWIGNRLSVIRDRNLPSGTIRLCAYLGSVSFGMGLDIGEARVLAAALIAQADAVQAGAV